MLEQSRWFDALEWFATAPTKVALKLIERGLVDTEESVEVAIWLSEYSQDAEVRNALFDLFTAMRVAQAAHPQAVGLRVEIDEAATRHFMEATLRAKRP